MCAPSGSDRAGAMMEKCQAEQCPPTRCDRTDPMVEESQAWKRLPIKYGEVWVNVRQKVLTRQIENSKNGAYQHQTNMEKESIKNGT